MLYRMKAKHRRSYSSELGGDNAQTIYTLWTEKRNGLGEGSQMIPSISLHVTCVCDNRRLDLGPRSPEVGECVKYLNRY